MADRGDQDGRNQFHRLIHGDNLIDGLAIATVERLLGGAGVDMAGLVDVTEPPATLAYAGAA